VILYFYLNNGVSPKNAIQFAEQQDEKKK
jgi:hypothetical protein